MKKTETEETGFHREHFARCRGRRGISGAKASAAVLLAAAVSVCVSGCGRPKTIRVTGISELPAWMEETRDFSADTDAGASRSDGNSRVAEQNPDGGAESAPAFSTASAQQDLSERITVYVRGAVVRPGVYHLESGSRVYQAIEAAGGFSPEADTEWLNQAELLSDGQMVTVSTREETSELSSAGGAPQVYSAGEGNAGGGMPDAAEPKVNLNTAQKEDLMTLPGIGESKAEAIIRYREENGLFASPEDVMNISGIKTAVFSRIKDRVTV